MVFEQFGNFLCIKDEISLIISFYSFYPKKKNEKQIRDTAGQERFRTLTTAYYRGAMGILLMYDVTSLESYNNLSYWLRNIQEVSIASMHDKYDPIIFIHNVSDLLLNPKLIFLTQISSLKECCTRCGESIGWK